MSLSSELALGRPPVTPFRSVARRRIEEFLDTADIRVGGDRPFDIQVHDERFYDRLLAYGSLGAGESYMDGWWDVPALDQLFYRVYRADPYGRLGRLSTALLSLEARVLNLQTRARAGRVAREHYDLGNDLYRVMLGRHMLYTGAYWSGANSLDQAQHNKLDLICRKLGLTPGMRVLDLGCGFGTLSRFMAAEYGCSVVGYNISAEQIDWARQSCDGLPVRLELRDYRDAAFESEPFHRIVTVGLVEHIGYKNYRAFFELVHRLLCPKGLFLLHTIGGNQSNTCTDPWIDRYIFPNGLIPSIAQLGAAMEGLWILEDWHNFGPDYDRTLMAWWENFKRGWPLLRNEYGERFYRMWHYYLLSCAGTFRARRLQLWQLVLSKGDIGSYTPVR